jgi:hypothetical protein
MANQCKLSAKRIANIRTALCAGATRKAAAAAAGIGQSTFHYWMRSGAGDDATDLQRRLVVAVEVAEGEAELRATATVDDAIGSGDWKAAAWWLERRRREDWGRQLLQLNSTRRDEPQSWAALVMLAGD